MASVPDNPSYIRRGNGRRRSPSGTYSDRRWIADLGVRAEVIGGLLETLQRRRWSRALHDFNRVVVLSSTICTALVALLFQHLLGLRVCEPEQQFHPIFGDVVEFTQHFLGDFTCIEAFKTLSDCVASGR